MLDVTSIKILSRTYLIRDPTDRVRHLLKGFAVNSHGRLLARRLSPLVRSSMVLHRRLNLILDAFLRHLDALAHGPTAATRENETGAPCRLLTKRKQTSAKWLGYKRGSNYVITNIGDLGANNSVATPTPVPLVKDTYWRLMGSRSDGASYNPTSFEWA